MNWEKRARDILLAGGALTVSACGVVGGTPCGNANPDPCVCGRPQASAASAAACSQKQACEAQGGSFDSPLPVNDGGQPGWACLMESGASDDASADATLDAADGSAVDAGDASAADADQTDATDAGAGGG